MAFMFTVSFAASHRSKAKNLFATSAKSGPSALQQNRLDHLVRARLYGIDVRFLHAADSSEVARALLGRTEVLAPSLGHRVGVVGLSVIALAAARGNLRIGSAARYLFNTFEPTVSAHFRNVE